MLTGKRGERRGRRNAAVPVPAGRLVPPAAIRLRVRQPAASAAGRGALFFIKSEGTGGGFGENRRLFVNFFRKSSFFFAIPGHLWYATLAFLWARFLFNKSMYFSSRFFYKRDLERMFQILWV